MHQNANCKLYILQKEYAHMAPIQRNITEKNKSNNQSVCGFHSIHKLLLIKYCLILHSLLLLTCFVCIMISINVIKKEKDKVQLIRLRIISTDHVQNNKVNVCEI